MINATHITLGLTAVGALGTGGLFTAMWNQFWGGRTRKLDEADVLSRLSTAIREEIREENKELRERMDRIVDAVCGLTDLLDELFPKFTDLTPEERVRLRARIAQAKRAT